MYDTDITALGCDAPGCNFWYHKQCLEHQELELAELSLDVGGDWLCPRCVTRVERTCAVCMVTEVNVENTAVEPSATGWIQCHNQDCNQWFHLLTCLPNAVVQDVINHPEWCCDACYTVPLNNPEI